MKGLSFHIITFLYLESKPLFGCERFILSRYGVGYAEGMKIAILGYEGQGQAAYQYWNRDDNTLVICDMDDNKITPPGAGARLGKDYLKSLDEFDMLVRTPGLHPRDIIVANPGSPNILDKVTAVTNEFFRVCPTQNIIGVTGTKGKGTTSTLVAKMLEASGKNVHLGGNIGVPPLEMLKNDIQPDDWVVLELANFQLIDLKYSPPLAICLMVVPEHLNWHEDFDEYIRAKKQLFRWQKASDKAIYFAGNDNSQKIVSISKGTKVPYYKSPGAEVVNNEVVIDGRSVCSVGEIKLLGKHNWQNACAAVTAVWQVAQNIEAIRSVLTSFTGLEHRLEFVRELNGVKYYDDSFGTTPETAIVAFEAFKEPKVVILGGSDKGSSYEELAQAVINNNVRSVISIGDTGSKIAEILRGRGYVNIVEGGASMREIVAAAQAQAQPGDVVLLSTGCASFGLFENYKDRGDKFIQAVKALV